jgi:hypothetical protein
MKNGHSLFLVSAICVCCATSGCDKAKSMTGDDVSLVKGAVLETDKSLTVGQAIDNFKYFKKPVKWEAGKTENGKRVVNVSASVDTATHPIYNAQHEPGLKGVEIKYQFVINQDGTFQIGGCGIALEKESGQISEDPNLSQAYCANGMRQIYANSSDIIF